MSNPSARLARLLISKRETKISMRNNPVMTKRWTKWALIFVCWTAFALFFASQNYLLQMRFGRPLEWKRVLVVWLLCGYTWCALTPLVLWLAHRFPLERGKLLRSIPIHLFASAFFSVLSLAIFTLAHRALFGSGGGTASPLAGLYNLVIAEFHTELLVYWAIIGIVNALDYYRRYQERELKASQLEARLVESQLEALRMQLHPHFLFNTLNSISVLMRRDVDAADRMLLQLSSLLRTTLARNTAHEIPLRQELEFLERYLEIEQTRYRDRLTVRMQIDPAALEGLVPQLIFQPLVENAIRHGIADRESGGLIEISAERRNGRLSLQVHDNGPGIRTSDGQFAEGVGLANTRTRLDHLYGPEGRFEWRNAHEGGLIVAATIPFHTATDAAAGGIK
ncbi:MAG: sensor histidine kinase [Acidobacteria bacterium]|nr:sensor histidine kinase [Acidobacteriota bacterium]